MHDGHTVLSNCAERDNNIQRERELAEKKQHAGLDGHTSLFTSPLQRLQQSILTHELSVEAIRMAKTTKRRFFLTDKHYHKSQNEA